MGENKEKNIAETPEQGAVFKGYKGRGSSVAAIFYDPETQREFFLDREEIEDKIENLKREGRSFVEEEKALKEWPRSIDKIII